MDYDPSDSSGTDDDLPPAYHNRGGTRGGRINGNGRTASVGGLPYNRPPNDMETQIHLLEQEAYSSVLRAFRAQSDALSWEKASLITELRRELRVSDDEHRELLSRVNADDTIRRIREFREAGGGQSGALNNVYPAQDQLHSPSVSASRKKQKTGQPVFGTPMQPSSVSAKVKISSAGSRGRKSKSGRTLSASEPSKAVPIDPMVGRKVMIRWPEDNNFYEAVITDYNPAEGLHALVYDINTSNETWEWVNLAEIPAEDIRLGGEFPGFSLRAGRGGSGRGVKKVMGRGGGMPSAGRGRGGLKNVSRNDFPPAQAVGGGISDEIKILSTDSLIKEVERVFSSNSSDPYMMEKAKQTLKDHERSLMEIIARLADASDGESDEGELQPNNNQGRGSRHEQEQDHEDEDKMIEI